MVENRDKSADETLRLVTDAVQKLAGRSRLKGFIPQLLSEKYRRLPSGNQSLLRELRRLIAWSSPGPGLPVIVREASLISKRLLKEVGLRGALSTDLSLFQSYQKAPRRRRILAYNDKIADLISAAAISSVYINLIVLPSYSKFIDILDELLSVPEVTPIRGKLPDIAVFTDDCTIFNNAWWHNSFAYETLVNPATVCVADKLIYLSYKKFEFLTTGVFAPGSLVAVHETDQVRFLINGYYAASAWTASTIGIIHLLLSNIRDEASCGDAKLQSRSFVVVQHGDYIQNRVRSVGYGKRRGDAPAVQLIPDAFFFDSGGYQVTRRAVVEGRWPEWRNREDVVFWRGSTTHHGVSPKGDVLEQVEQIPRVAMCLALRDQPKTDVAIRAPWGFEFPLEYIQRRLVDAGIYRPGIPILQHARYRYLIDIDGVASA